MRIHVPIAALLIAALAAGAMYSRPPVPAAAAPAQALADFVPASVASTTETLYPIRSVGGGVVVLSVALDTEGRVEAIHVLRDIPPLTDAAMLSVRRWTFRPATLNGAPRASEMTVAFVFRPPVTVWMQPPFRPATPAGAISDVGHTGNVPAGVRSVAYADYPVSRTTASGSVVIELSLNSAGTVTDTRVARALDPMTSVAAQAASEWQFEPARLDGTPVASNLAVCFVFIRPV